MSPLTPISRPLSAFGIVEPARLVGIGRLFGVCLNPSEFNQLNRKIRHSGRLSYG